MGASHLKIFALMLGIRIDVLNKNNKRLKAMEIQNDTVRISTNGSHYSV